MGRQDAWAYREMGGQAHGWADIHADRWPADEGAGGNVIMLNEEDLVEVFYSPTSFS